MEVHASATTRWSAPILLACFGTIVLALATLRLTDRIAPSSGRYGGDASAVVALVAGFVILGLTTKSFARSWVSRDKPVIVVRSDRMLIQTFDGEVDVHLDEIEYITPLRRHGVPALDVGDTHGRVHRPILQPDGEDWSAVSIRLSEMLAEHRRAGHLDGRFTAD